MTVCGGGQRIDIFAAAMQRRRKLPITIGAYGEGGAPINNDGQGIWHQDYGGAPDSPTHVYHGWVFPAVLLYDAARLGSHIDADQVPEISGRGYCHRWY